MRSDITPGQTSDYLGFDLIMDDNLPEPSVLLADRGYDSDRVRETMEARNVVPVITMRKSRKLRVAVDRTLYRLRNLVERCFNKLKQWRGLAMRSDKYARNYHAGICLAATLDWLRTGFSNTPYDRARNRGCRHPHAARILAQGWTRILWRCWHDHQPYNPDLHGRLNTLQQEAA